jgi:hypothetical protein
LLIVRLDTVNNFNADTIFHPGIKEEFAWGKQFIGIADFQNINGSPAYPGYFECPSIQVAEFSIPAPGSFRENKKIAASLQIPWHGFHLPDHQLSKWSFTCRRQVTRPGNYPAKDRDFKKSCFNDGPLLLEKSNEQ